MCFTFSGPCIVIYEYICENDQKDAQKVCILSVILTYTNVFLQSLRLEYVPESNSELKQNVEHTSLFILTQAADKNN